MTGPILLFRRQGWGVFRWGIKAGAPIYFGLGLFAIKIGRRAEDHPVLKKRREEGWPNR